MTPSCALPLFIALIPRTLFLDTSRREQRVPLAAEGGTEVVGMQQQWEHSSNKQELQQVLLALLATGWWWQQRVLTRGQRPPADAVSSCGSGQRQSQTTRRYHLRCQQQGGKWQSPTSSANTFCRGCMCNPLRIAPAFRAKTTGNISPGRNPSMLSDLRIKHWPFAWGPKRMLLWKGISTVQSGMCWGTGGAWVNTGLCVQTCMLA